jgi:uncharacterized protein (TIRG00374 family)
MARPALTILNICVSVGLTAWALSGFDPADLLRVATTAHWSLLLVALSLHGTGLVLSALRWTVLLEIQKLQYSFRAAVLLYWIGCFFNAVLPTGVGGDVVRSYLAGKQNGRIMDTALSVILERAAGLTALAILFGVGIVWLRFFSGLESLWAYAGFGTAGLLCTVSVPQHRLVFRRLLARLNIHRKLPRVRAILLKHRSEKLKLLWILVLSFLLQVNVVLYYYIIAEALGIHLSFFHFCLLIPPIIVLTMLPVSIGGLGVRETSFLFFFAPLGITGPHILSLSLWSYVLSLIANLSGGLVYWFYRPLRG